MLRSIRGVGPWTAECVAMRACRDSDAFPDNDLGLLRAAGRGQPMTSKQLRARAENWRPWRAYAAVYLWSSP